MDGGDVGMGRDVLRPDECGDKYHYWWHQEFGLGGFTYKTIIW